MQVDEILGKVRFVVDPETGEKSAVLIDYVTWEEMLKLLDGTEELAEARESDRHRPGEQATGELNYVGKDDAWITNEINKVCAEVDTSLDPALYAMQWASLPKEDW